MKKATYNVQFFQLFVADAPIKNIYSFTPSQTWFFNKMVLQNTLRSDASTILKSIHVREIVREFVWCEAMIDRYDLMIANHSQHCYMAIWINVLLYL